MRWRGTTPSPVAGCLRGWDGESQIVFFEPRSGATHLLSALSGLLLVALEQRSLEFDDLLDLARAAIVNTAEPAALPVRLREHLDELTRLGLLREDPVAAPPVRFS